MYHRGVERLQQRVELRSKFYYFHLPFTGIKWESTLFAFDNIHQQPLQNIKLPQSLEIKITHCTKMAQIMDYLLIFTNSSQRNGVRVQKLDNLCTKNLTATELPLLDRLVKFFAVANFMSKRVYLSGGE